MHCEFYGGPVDGLKRECPVARIGERWRVLCAPRPVVSFVEDPGMEFEPMPVAEYRLVAGARMEYVGMIPR